MIRLCARVELIINTIVQYIVIYIYILLVCIPYRRTI